MIRVLALLSLLLSVSFPTEYLKAQSASSSNSPAAPDLQWFQSTEQSLMDAIAVGDKAVWDRVMDEDCVVTTEEGDVLPKKKFLEELTGLPKGLSGSIKVKDLTVQGFGDFAIVRFRLEEQENVFGQEMANQYRVTDAFRRVEGDWKMVASHFTVVTIDPPAQAVSKATWPGLAGTYKLLPDGWTFRVVLRDGVLYGARGSGELRPFIPLAPNVFTLKGGLGEWIFVAEKGTQATKIVHFRKFETLIWTRVPGKR